MKKYVIEKYELLEVLAKNIKKFRTRAKLSAEELSIIIGKPQYYISLIENLKLDEEIDALTALLISKALKVSLDDLIKISTPKKLLLKWRVKCHKMKKI